MCERERERERESKKSILSVRNDGNDEIIYRIYLHVGHLAWCNG